MPQRYFLQLTRRLRLRMLVNLFLMLVQAEKISTLPRTVEQFCRVGDRPHQALALQYAWSLQS